MRRMQPTAWFWVVAAAVLAVALFTMHDAHGQGSGATFQGRPAMAGAQAGTGAMAGPPQGGVAPQSPNDPGGGITLQRKASPTDVAAAGGPAVPRDPGGVVAPSKDGVQVPGRDGVAPQRDRDSGNVVKRERGQDATGGNTSTTRKAKRAAKRSAERARRGVSGVDS